MKKEPFFQRGCPKGGGRGNQSYAIGKNTQEKKKKKKKKAKKRNSKKNHNTKYNLKKKKKCSHGDKEGAKRNIIGGGDKKAGRITVGGMVPCGGDTCSPGIVRSLSWVGRITEPEREGKCNGAGGEGMIRKGQVTNQQVRLGSRLVATADKVWVTKMKDKKKTERRTLPKMHKHCGVSRKICDDLKRGTSLGKSEKKKTRREGKGGGEKRICLC